jgi:hypothetical protein
VLLETLEADTPLCQVGDDLNERAERAPEAVQLPEHQHVACAQVGEHVLQDGALAACPADDLLIDLPADSLPEGIELEGQTLHRRAHPGVPDLHRVLQKFGIPVVFSSKHPNPFFERRGCQGGLIKSRKKEILPKPKNMDRENDR